MATLARPYAVEHDGLVNSDLDPRARAILERMARCAYVRDQHRLAVARITREIEKLRAELDLSGAGA